MESNVNRVKCGLNLVKKFNEIYNNLVKSSVICENNSVVSDLRYISVECKPLEDIGSNARSDTTIQTSMRKRFTCFWPKCRYSTKYEHNLNIHISKHSNEKQFKCNECNKRFNYLSDLNRHKRCVHSNERPFVCPVSDCRKTFKYQSVLIRHKQNIQTKSHSNAMNATKDSVKHRI